MIRLSWFRAPVTAAALALATGACFVSTGCSNSKETAQKDTLTQNVGVYPPAPNVAYKPRVGVPPFNVESNLGGNGKDLNDLAADQMTTLLDQSGRFTVIERAQLQQLTKEQGLEGIVKADELAQRAQVRGVDYLLLGKVTNLRVKKETTKNNFGAAQLTGLINVGGADVNKSNIVITTECGVDIRLVNPSTGEMMVTTFSEYKKTDSADSMGLSILGANAQSDANIDLSEDDKGKILRLALDDSLRKALPKIDTFVRTHQDPVAPPAPPVAPSADAAAMNAAKGATPAPAAAVPAAAPAAAPPANGAIAAKHFCPNCGKEVAEGVKFCPSCGAKQ